MTDVLSSSSSILFARKCTENQLRDYVVTFPMRIVWVSAYTQEECVSYLDKTSYMDIFFMQLLPYGNLLPWLKHQKMRIHLVNTEQMSRYNTETKHSESVFFPFDTFIFDGLRGETPLCCTLWDYSARNLEMAKKHVSRQLNLRLFCFKPINYYKKKQDFDASLKQKNCVFIGDASSKYRQKAIQQIASLVDIDVVTNLFGPQRDLKLLQYKILVNVHYAPSYCVFEEMRCLPCLLTNTIIVSEDSLLDPKHPIAEFIIFSPYDSLHERVQEVLKNYEFYYELFFVQKKKQLEHLVDAITTYEQSFSI